MKRMAVLAVIFLCGCSMAQMRQEFLGYSIQDVKDSKNKQVTTYDMSADECFDKIKSGIADMGGVIEWEDRGKRYIIAMRFDEDFRPSIDTTQVGILTTSLGQNSSQVEIASSNNDLAVFVSKKLDNRLKGIVEPVAEKKAEDTHDKKNNAG